MPTLPVTAADIIETLNRLTASWHEDEGLSFEQGENSFVNQAVITHRFNFQLWHEEDVARMRDIPDARIAEVKRAIDGFNQARNDSIQEWDSKMVYLLDEAGIAPADEVPMNSETPGSIADRMSIMSLKVFHMAEQLERSDVDEAHLRSCAAKLATLKQQQQDLGLCLDQLQEELFASRRRLKVYFQHKMYNDPTLNPALYGAADNS